MGSSGNSYVTFLHRPLSAALEGTQAPSESRPRPRVPPETREAWPCSSPRGTLPEKHSTDTMKGGCPPRFTETCPGPCTLRDPTPTCQAPSPHQGASVKKDSSPRLFPVVPGALDTRPGQETRPSAAQPCLPVWAQPLRSEPEVPGQPCWAHLDAAVVHARRLALDAAGVAAAGAAFHLHARGPDQEVGGRGVHLAPRYLINDRPGLADGGDGFLCRGRAW